MPPGGQALDAIAQFGVNVGGGHHGHVAFRFGPVEESVEDSLLALQEEPTIAFSVFLAVAPVLFFGDSSHSKPSVAWNNQDA
jgi:hypothetical protein